MEERQARAQVAVAAEVLAADQEVDQAAAAAQMQHARERAALVLRYSKLQRFVQPESELRAERTPRRPSVLSVEPRRMAEDTRRRESRVRTVLGEAERSAE
jgi:broad specificity phosphatase PhoE